MQLTYISKSKRRYPSLGKELPNKKDPSKNTIDVADSLGNILLLEREGSQPLWKKE